MDGLKSLCEEYACSCHFEMKTLKPERDKLLTELARLQQESLRLKMAVEQQMKYKQEVMDDRARIVDRAMEGIEIIKRLESQVGEWKQAARQRSECVKELLEKLDEVRKELETTQCQLSKIRALVDDQADDEGLWYIPDRASEAYIQQEFRKLHALVEMHVPSKGDKG